MVNKQSETLPQHPSPDDLRGKISKYVPSERVPKKLNIITDTTNYFKVDYDNVLVLGGRYYFIRQHEREGRFGIEDQPKYWVRRAIDLQTGEIKIIKMVFLEKMNARAGDLVFECVRSPAKEARILELVRDHPNFMHGTSANDSAGNNVRIIDYIPGRTMADIVEGTGTGHEDYFHNYFPVILNDYIGLVRAIEFLHKHGEKHGDIRRDHIIRDRNSNIYRWIDFDFSYWHHENIFGYDLFGLGSILVYLAGRGDVIIHELKHNDHPALGRLTADDLGIIFNNRVTNLKKVYPYIPDQLNLVLLHFSTGAEVFYEDTGQLLDDLTDAREHLKS